MRDRRGAVRRTTITPLVIVPLAVAQVLYWLARLVGSGWLVVLAAAAMGPPVVAMLLRPRIDALSVEVSGPPVGTVGSDVRLHVVIRNGSAQPTDAVRVSLHDGHDPVGLDVPALPGGCTVECDVVAALSVRGVADERAEVVAFGPFGFLRAQRTLTTRRGVLTAAALVAQDMPRTRAAGGRDSTLSAQRGSAEIAGVREWRRGDPAQHLHWRSTARRGRLVVIDRVDLHTAAAACVLAVGARPGPQWEAVVSRATAALLAAHREGRAVFGVSPAVDGGVLLLHELGDAAAVLAWSARAPLGLPDTGALRAIAAAAARHTQDLVVVATADVPAAWWHELQAACGAFSLRPVHLPDPFA